MTDGSSFQLEVSIDASGIEERSPGQALKVLAYRGVEPLRSAVVHLDARGQGVVTLAFAHSPGALRIAVGPAEATDAHLIGAQTLGVDVPARSWAATRVVTLSVPVPQFYWSWWMAWTRRFSIEGRVLRPDGASPAAGVDVAAFDVRGWGWWSSRREVGATRTDANGSFTIHFDWCCGLRPWWWWRERSWRASSRAAVGRAGTLGCRAHHGAARGHPGRSVRRRGRAPVPDLSVFADRPRAGGRVSRSTILFRRPSSSRPPPRGLPTCPAVTTSLRAAVLGRLPASPELERLGVWPWRPWNPWWDAAPPNLAFTGRCRPARRATRSSSTRASPPPPTSGLDVPTSLAVTLTAGSNARRTVPPSLRPTVYAAPLSRSSDPSRGSILLLGTRAGGVLMLFFFAARACVASPCDLASRPLPGRRWGGARQEPGLCPRPRGASRRHAEDP